ncbi:1-acyl-sn-glycerol-3-phosphate acyltransferase [Flavihumibacter petaseus]|nr:1-acyl-sn-glycerol-3-phosphate acyltransferase [Flavihumibacter petaseus]
MRCALNLFYTRIGSKDLQLIPDKGPVILIANHPSSLMDAALLGVQLKRPLHFFARGDLFRNAFAAWILRRLHMHPIHHHQNGRSTLNDNDDSFEVAMQLLEAGEIVLFFPEGISQTAYRLLPFKKGAFRLAVQMAMKNSAQPCPVVPVGINYSHPKLPFSQVWIHAGTPFLPAHVPSEATDTQAFNQVVRLLTLKGAHAISQLVIADDHHPVELAEAMFVYRNNATDPDPSLMISNEIQFARKISSQHNRYLAEINLYREARLRCGVTPTAPRFLKDRSLSSWPLWLGFPAAAIGWLLNALPLQVGKWIADKKVTREDFYSWVLVVVSLFLYLFWWLAITLLTGIIAGKAMALTTAIALPLSGYAAWKYYQYFVAWKDCRAVRQLNTVQKAVLEDLAAGILTAAPV